MWQRFSEYARKSVFFAQEEAQRTREPYVDPDALLLGILRNLGCEALAVLEQLSVNVHELRKSLEKFRGIGSAPPSQDMTLTPNAKRVIDLAFDNARNLNDNYIGTQHLLIGIVAEGRSKASDLLSEMGANYESVLKVLKEFRENGRFEEVPNAQSKQATRPEAAERVPAQYERLFLLTRQKVFTPRLLLLLAIADEDSDGRGAFAKAAGTKAKLLHYLLEDRLMRAKESPSLIGLDKILAEASAIATDRRETLSSKHIFLAIYGLKADPYLQELIGDMSLENLMNLLDEEV